MERGGQMGVLRTAVIATDCQFDFTIAGALPVPGANGEWIWKINNYLFWVLRQRTHPAYDGAMAPRIVATKDYHPPGHISFSKWPAHCVENTPGSSLVFSEGFVDTVIYKGVRKEFDSYSAFQDDGGAETQLQRYLSSGLITRLIVFGLATEYCVKATVLHALSSGYEVLIKPDLCCGIDRKTTREAIEEMRDKGAQFVF